MYNYWRVQTIFSKIFGLENTTLLLNKKKRNARCLRCNGIFQLFTRYNHSINLKLKFLKPLLQIFYFIFMFFCYYKILQGVFVFTLVFFFKIWGLRKVILIFQQIKKKIKSCKCVWIMHRCVRCPITFVWYLKLPKMPSKVFFDSSWLSHPCFITCFHVFLNMLDWHVSLLSVPHEDVLGLTLDKSKCYQV